MQLHLPQGIIGWTLFLSGLLIITFRIRGIDAPRQWAESIERMFVYAINLRFLGGVFFAGALTLGYFAGVQQGFLAVLFYLCLLMFLANGIGLLVFQNHLRHLIVASAESSDTKLRIMSIIIILSGLALMLAPFLF